MKLPCFLVIFAVQTMWVNAGSFADAREKNHVAGRNFKIFGTYHVHVRNELSNSKKLWLHCRSKDDDLGLQELSVNEDFSWSFKMNIWATTLYWCEAQKELSPEHVSFTSFSGDPAILNKCNKNVCTWAAKQDGIYMITGTGAYELWYHWNKK